MKNSKPINFTELDITLNKAFNVIIINSVFILNFHNYFIILSALLFFLLPSSLYSSTNTAILNIHWGMNPKQVENAVNAEFEEQQNSTDRIKIFNNRLRIVGRASGFFGFI